MKRRSFLAGLLSLPALSLSKIALGASTEGATGAVGIFPSNPCKEIILPPRHLPILKTIRITRINGNRVIINCLGGGGGGGRSFPIVPQNSERPNWGNAEIADEREVRSRG